MKRLILPLLALCAALMLLCGCTREKPPENGTPEPATLCGDYTGEYGTFSFDGDGKSISFELSPELAAAAGLPESGEGEYCFTFAHGEYRYDLAENMEIICGGSTVRLMNVHGETCEDVIVLLHPASCEDMRFERNEEQ